MNLGELLEGLSLGLLVEGGQLRTSHAAHTEATLEVVLDRSSLDDGIAEGLQELGEVGVEVEGGGPALVLVTLDPGKKTIPTKK